MEEWDGLVVEYYEIRAYLSGKALYSHRESQGSNPCHEGLPL